MNILFGNEPKIGLPEPEFTTAPADNTRVFPGPGKIHVCFKSPCVLPGIAPDGSGTPIINVFGTTPEDREIKTPPSLLKPVLFGVAALVALNFLT